MDRKDEQASSENVLSLCARVLAEENLRAFRTTDTSAVCRPASLDRRVRKLIGREYYKREYGRLYVYGRRIAAALILVCTVSLASALGVEAVRSGLWSSVVEFFDDHMSVIFVSETVPPETIDVIKEPVVEQEGWTRTVLLNEKTMYVVVYRDLGGKRALSYSQHILDGSNHLVDNENTIREEVEINGNEALLITRYGDHAYFLRWSDGEYSYNLDVYVPEISKDDLISIAESIK